MEQRKQTAVTALFAELKLLAEGMRFSQDNESAGLIDYICTREPIVLQWERDQIREAYYKGVRDEWEGAGRDFEDYYNETYANDTTTGLPKEDSKRRGWHY